jgi:hypothetical protein
MAGTTEETISFLCPCGSVLHAEYPGESTRCPDCRVRVRAPGERPGAAWARANPLAIGSGVVAIVAAAVWLVAGLEGGVFFYGPALVFGIGVGRIIQGLPGPDPSTSGAPPC